MLDTLQKKTSSQQTSLSPLSTSGNVQSSAAVAVQQQQLQQLLYQQQQSSNRHGLVARKQPFSNALPAFGAWPWNRPAATGFSSRFSASHRDHTTSPIASDQQLCPQLDGAFLAECIKASASGPSLTSHTRSMNPTSHFFSATSHLPVGNAYEVAGLKAEPELSVGLVSPTTSFQSLSSSISALTAKPEAELPAELCSADASLDSPLGECCTLPSGAV